MVAAGAIGALALAWIATQGWRSGAQSASRDVTPPIVKIASPVDRGPLSGVVPILVTASDDVGIAAVQIKIDGELVGPELTSAPYRVDWDSASRPAGSHVIEAVARDAAGNSDRSRFTITTDFKR
jgi:hypothetical protein